MAPRILVFGTGAIGAIYGYILSKAVSASNIVAVCRSNYDAALTNGFTVHSSLWGRSLHYKPHVVRSPRDAIPFGPFDYIVITAKIVDSKPSIPTLLRPIVSPTTSLVLIQNGISIEQPYSTAFPSNPILSCTTYLPVTQTSPGIIEHVSGDKLNVGTYPSTAPQTHHSSADQFVSLIRAGGASATLLTDIQPERWTKLLANASWNPITALSRSRDAQFLHSSPHALDYVRATMREVASVARALGYESVNDDAIEETLSRSRGRSLPGVEPSMLADVLAGRAMEVDAILGNVVKIAEEKGVNVPLLKGNYMLLKALDESLRRERGEDGVTTVKEEAS